MNVKAGDTIAVWFSCGAASAVATKLTIEKYGHMCNIRILNNPIKEEHSDNRRFLRDVEQWLGIKIETVTSTNYPSQSCADVWADRKFMSSPQGAPCTLHLKKRARQSWESNNHFDWLVLGFTAEEVNRADRFKLSERENLLSILIDENITKADCFRIIASAGIRLPEVYLMGYPNGNCIGCVKATSPTYWNFVRLTHPVVFVERARQSRELGAKLVRLKGKRIFLDELDPLAKGRPMKNMDFECGIFCEG